MDNKEFQFLREMLHAQGIEIHVFETPFEYFPDFDKGLRAQLYKNYEYQSLRIRIQEHMLAEHMYIVMDPFGVNYIFISGKDEKKLSWLITAGPYLESETHPDTEEIIKKNGLEIYHTGILKEYYNSIPTLQNVESMMHVFMQYFGYEFKMERHVLELESPEELKGLEVKVDEDNLSLSLIEERYRCEDALLSAIEQGDLTKVLLLENEIGKYRVEARSRDNMRNNKNMLLTMNVLFRKSVQKAKVHPAHIDAVSASFAKRIESCRTDMELSKLTGEMTRKYCRLVQTYSLRGYSELIEQVINYIDFHLKEPLSLGYLAEKFSVNGSYLSSQFKKENGNTLTGYLNEKRVESSQILLATTSLPIQEVAARVGIYDENYFSRLFKKLRQMTPREYRNKMQISGSDRQNSPAL